MIYRGTLFLSCINQNNIEGSIDVIDRFSRDKKTVSEIDISFCFVTTERGKQPSQKQLQSI